MRILLFTPYFEQPRGNSTTAKRIHHFLQKRGLSVEVMAYMENSDLPAADPDLYHILHATHFTNWAKEHQFTLNRPYVVTMGGTDINLDLQSGMEADMFTFLNEAKFITVFTQEAKEKVIRLFPGWATKTAVIPQGIWIPWNLPATKENMKPRFLLPSGLRPVKDVLHALPALDELVLQYPELSFSILGPNLDEMVHSSVLQAASLRPWMHYEGTVPLEKMEVKFAVAQIVLNTSWSEGQSVAIMEAMAMGLPVIARNIPANRQLISHEQTGWLYGTMEEFKEAVHAILTDNTLRDKVVKHAQDWIKENFSPEKEADAYTYLFLQMI